MIDFGYNNKKTNIKVNILLAAFLEIELYDNIDCYTMVNSLLKKHIGIWVAVHKSKDDKYHFGTYINSNNKWSSIHFHEIKFDNRLNCFKAGLKVILAYICYLASDDKNSTYNIVEHDSYYVKAINEIIDTCEAFGLDLKANYNKYHATIDCYFSDLIESILI